MELVRYNVIAEKNPREIILLRGLGCKWKRCKFCDYHLDFSTDAQKNFLLNKKVIDKVSGVFKNLEVINSGSFCELDTETLRFIKAKCLQKNIQRVCFETHWMYREKISSAKKFFAPINLNFKIGVETFDTYMREEILQKGFGNVLPNEIAQFCQQVCLLFGIHGQTLESMQNDIDVALKYFARVCINIMNKNSTKIIPDQHVINLFRKNIFPLYKNNSRVEILFSNNDFGVGYS